MPLLQSFADTLTDPRAATAAFWSTIAQYGTAFNLLILRQVTASRLPEFKDLFYPAWRRRWTDKTLDALQQKGLLYEIDFSMFESNKPYYFDVKDPRYNPATVTLLVRDPHNIGHLEPQIIRVWGDKRAELYDNTDPGWLYAVQAAKASVTLYGIWLGHVYHWHIVTAAMQQAMYDTIPPNTHPVFKLLQPMSNFLIAFDYALFNKLILGEVDLFSRIAPPTCAANANIVLKLFDKFAAGRLFFDDDPKNELARNGIVESHFTRDKPWDMYPVARHLLLVWDICDRFVNTFVSATYPDDRAVAADTALRAWMKAAADPNQGNIRGLPAMENREALRRVLTSFVYRVTIHGVSRLQHTANPELTWVANFPPCLQREGNPWPMDKLSTKELLTYLPNTGTIAEMITFYFAFAFSKPYVSFFRGPDFSFPGDYREPRNAALLKFRLEMDKFINSEYKWWRKPLWTDNHQWPRNIET